jgi:acyl-CoA synthetase (AMP-forming)/AMP-acid ligase II
VISAFGAMQAGAVFVPLNPLLKAEQVAYILRDCNVRVLVTSVERLAALAPVLAQCHDLRHVVLTGHGAGDATIPQSVVPWAQLQAAGAARGHRVIDDDMVAILYTSGSTGQPKGVVLSHRNMVTGAKSVASYLENRASDTLLAALPLSFDAGFSQLTTAFHVGARVVLLNYLLPKDVLNAAVKERITGLTAVPPLWIQLTQLQWPDSVTEHLRYIANTGGRMPLETLTALRKALPRTRPYLMYGGPKRSVRPICRPMRSIAGQTRSARQSPTAKCWYCATTEPPVHPTSPASWCSVGRWSAWATGTIPREPPSGTGRFQAVKQG